MAGLEKRFNRIFYLKIGLIFVTLALAAFWAVSGARGHNTPVNYLGCAITVLGGIFLFILLDIRHHRVIERQKFTAILMEINEASLKRLDGRWNGFADSGAEFMEVQHPYSHDLDLFGPNSLFQWINVANTFLGRRRLAHWIGSFPAATADIMARQEAIEELAQSLSWRQRFSAHGIAVATRLKDPAHLFQWAQERNPLFTRRSVIWLLRFLSLTTVGALVIFFGFRRLPFYLPLFLFLVHLVLMKIGRKKREAILVTAAAYQQDLALYKDLIRAVETRKFHSPLLKNLQSRLRPAAGGMASDQLRRLEKIVDAIANRNNAFFALINVITLWDYHCLIALEKWKAEAGRQLALWLETLGRFEALASLAIVNCDHPDWARPALAAEPCRYFAKDLGHPLLTEDRRVVNDLQIEPPTQTLLITGSNMSGKSTYLRTAGINLVLAYAGARVCARECRCSPMRIFTCMRVSDNLEQNISSFYAEILRIKMIVQAAAEFPVFFLLDEIFKGTNSVDRHNGAKILIHKLIRHHAVGLVSTHDLELGELAAENRTVQNYHFQEFYENDQLRFDYRLRSGISTTRNALHLMKLAGITFD